MLGSAFGWAYFGQGFAGDTNPPPVVVLTRKVAGWQVRSGGR